MVDFTDELRELHQEKDAEAGVYIDGIKIESLLWVPGFFGRVVRVDRIERWISADLDPMYRVEMTSVALKDLVSEKNYITSGCYLGPVPLDFDPWKPND